MPRKRSGSVEPRVLADGSIQYHVRLRLADGTKSPSYKAPSGISAEEAKAFAEAEQASEEITHEIYNAVLERRRRVAARQNRPAPAELANDWHERFLLSREGKVGNNRDHRWIWSKWFSDTIGKRPMADVTREEIETIRDTLDARIHDGTLRPKTAANVWSACTTAFRAAVGSKQRDLRVRTDNPCDGVQPPDRGESRRKCWLYPSEVDKLLRAEAVPLEWRELYAVSCYLYTRPSETHELRWFDVDFAANVVRISRAYDWEAKAVKEPKTRNGIRTVPIPATLLPLLERMRAGQASDALVVPAMQKAGKREAATILRKHLALAGVDHPRLFRDDATFMPVGFRSFRDSGITYGAIEGVDLAKLQRRAGHDHVSTTLGYVKAAEDFSGGGIGVPFGPLPVNLVGGASGHQKVQKVAQVREIIVGRPGLEDGSGLPFLAGSHGYEGADCTEPVQKTAKPVPIGQAFGQQNDPLGSALGLALKAATEAGNLTLVTSIVEEIRQHRLAASPNVVVMPATKGRAK